MIVKSPSRRQPTEGSETHRTRSGSLAFGGAATNRFPTAAAISVAVRSPRRSSSTGKRAVIAPLSSSVPPRNGANSSNATEGWEGTSSLATNQSAIASNSLHRNRWGMVTASSRRAISYAFALARKTSSDSLGLDTTSKWIGTCGPAQKSKVYLSENSHGSHASSRRYSCIQKVLDRSTDPSGGQAGCPSQRSSFRSDLGLDMLHHQFPTSSPTAHPARLHAFSASQVARLAPRLRNSARCALPIDGSITLEDAPNGTWERLQLGARRESGHYVQRLVEAPAARN